ncbi:uncharacterized protein JCM6883_004281 [Sporobolomyces salmoneus]|uniref:uncharacterized protein n=1 Tax=Sporobolomyces salmoneus TaxID=183962 RepID=UPI003171AE5C
MDTSSSPPVTFASNTSPSTSNSHRSNKLLSTLKGMISRRRRPENLNLAGVASPRRDERLLPPLPVDAASTIKRARRQTYVMHSTPSPKTPNPLPVLTLSSHHLVVCQKDRRDLANRHSYLESIPEYSQTRDDCYTSSSSIASCSSSASSIHSFDYSVEEEEDEDEIAVESSPQSHWSDDSSSEEFDCTNLSTCQCQDLTFTKSSRLCPTCTSQDVPEDEGILESDVDSLLDSYFDEDESEDYNRERWRQFSTASSSSSASTHYDPLFSPRSSSTTFTVASPLLYKPRPETPVDIRDFDMILTSSPPSPHGVRFNRASIDARDALIAESRRKRISNGTI